jgi:hypothetical protein
MKYDASGVFEATEVMVSAKSAGELLQFDILEGQNLKAYETVGYIDTIQLYLQKEQLEANLLSVESRHYDVSTQIASIRQQISTQKKEQKRFEDLVRNNAANQKQLDDINEQIKLLEKQLSAKEETLTKGNESVYGDIKSLTAQIELIKDQIKKSIICSPINGTVLTKYMEKGELAVQGKALFKVADMENIYLRAYITADQLTTLKIGQKVKVYADQGKSDRKEYNGTVTWISDKAEFTPKTIQTRDERANLVYAVKVMVRNDGYIKRGMYGELKIN